MGIVLFIIYILLSIINIKKETNLLTITLVYLIIGPNIRINTMDIDATYLVITFLLILMFVKKKNIKIIQKTNKYLVLIAFNIVLYTIMTLIYFDFNSAGIASLVGLLKILILLIIIQSCFYKQLHDSESYNKAFKITLLINFIGVIMQTIYGSTIRSFFEKMYLTNNYTYYASLSDKFVYLRKFGFFGSPMLLGLFCLLALLFFLTKNEERNEYKRVLYIILTMVVGILSLSKTFLIGSVFILIYIIVLNHSKQKKSKKSQRKAIWIIAFILCLPIIVVIGKLFFTYMFENTPLSYYLNLVAHPFSALNSRYDVSSDNILLTKTYDVIKEHYIFGVGVQSVSNEFLGDSTYVLALHNGGIISLLSILVFYVTEYIQSLLSKNKKSALFYILWALCGIGMNCLFNTIMIIPFYLYFILASKKEDKEYE